MWHPFCTEKFSSKLGHYLTQMLCMPRQASDTERWHSQIYVTPMSLSEMLDVKSAALPHISRMELKRHGRRKPWMARKKGRNERELTTGKLKKPFSNFSTDSRYHTPSWKATRQAVLQRDPVCVWCLECSKLTPSTEADHIIPSRRLDEYSFYDQSNIVGSCRSCNSRRASYEAKGVRFDTFDEWAKFLKKKNGTNS